MAASAAKKAAGSIGHVRRLCSNWPELEQAASYLTAALFEISQVAKGGSRKALTTAEVIEDV